MITILVSTASKGSSTFEFIRRVLSIHTNPCQALSDGCFSRSVKISKNKVYRIGMVLNKVRNNTLKSLDHDHCNSQVGWYPMGVCTRRVNSEGSFFTFCVGQPNDTLRDGLIRCTDLLLFRFLFLHQLF